MESSEKVTLPITALEYSVDNQRVISRTIEQAFDDLRIDLVNNRDTNSKPASMALRRHQFLLMGG